jgi:hypothetical protein
LQERDKALRIALKSQFLGLAGFLAALVPGGPAGAELRVTESTVPGIAIDASFPDNAVFDVPAGKKLKFLKSPTNSTHEMTGPYKGTLGAYTPGCSWLDWATGTCSHPSDQPGATRAAPVAGATRGLRSPPPAAPQPGATLAVPPPSGTAGGPGN